MCTQRAKTHKTPKQTEPTHTHNNPQQQGTDTTEIYTEWPNTVFYTSKSQTHRKPTQTNLRYRRNLHKQAPGTRNLH